ncbi:MAG: SurA N-terminal domain-containing protein [Pelagibacteraceae bacterium]|jgi:peptidyl-prolyl cis-trans isomerase D|nr:SurA N-terminal domain-containing protein [Pelagibacteraceae bacterium]
MLTSITKLTKSFLFKVLIGIIILPFVFWGMGDVFRSGNQNVIVTIDNEKVSAQSFAEYVNRLNLNEQQRNNLTKTDLLDRILSDYIGKKIIALEIVDQGINLNNKSLKEIIVNDKVFQKDNKFSRTKYEKFLLESSLSAPLFEQNISEQEKKRQLLTFLSKGISLPDYLIEKEYASENQVKTIKYLQLDNLYKDYSVSEKEIKKTYEENKKFLIQDFKEINYVELLPNNLTGQKEYNKSYFKKIDEIENNILDNMKMSDILKEYNLSPKVIKKVNIQRKDKTGKEIVEVNKELFTEIFNSKNINEPKLTNLNNKFYLSVILSVEKISRSLEDKEIKETIISQLKLKHIIDSNTKIIKEMSKGNFKKEQFQNFSKDKKLEIKNAIIKNIKDEIIFKSDMIKEIFKMNDGEFQLITNSLLTQNYIIYSEKTEELAFDKNNKDYEQYKARAKLNIANQIYTDYDKTVNNKYDVKINEKVLNRIKNTL